MTKSRLPIKAWALIGSTVGTAFIVWLAFRYAGLFQPEVRGLIACCLAAVVTAGAAYGLARLDR